MDYHIRTMQGVMNGLESISSHDPPPDMQDAIRKVGEEVAWMAKNNLVAPSSIEFVQDLLAGLRDTPVNAASETTHARLVQLQVWLADRVEGAKHHAQST